MLNRRSFIERLGLGAGATMLGPVAGSLFQEAQGQVLRQKRLIVLIAGQGLSHEMLFTPPEVRVLDPGLNSAVLPGVVNYTWPAFAKKLEAYRSRTLLIDGLSNALPRAMHSGGHGALSCFTAANGGSNEVPTSPGGVTIDQFIAQRIGKSTPFRSICIGHGRSNATFASAAERSEPAMVDPIRAYKAIFGTIGVDTTGVKGASAIKQKALFDVYREDIKKLASAVAGPERLKLEHYLASVEAIDARTRSLMNLGACTPPGAPLPSASGLPVEDQLEALTGMATTALICGMTNVVSIAAGCSNPHHVFPAYGRALRDAGLAAGTNWTYGHAGPELMGPGMTAVYNFLSGLLAKMADALSATTVGDRSLFEDTVMIMMSDNAEAHHAGHWRWPLVVVGNAGGALKADGRFLRFPQGPTGRRALADLYCSLGHATGAPTDTFGKGGTEKVLGPLPEIMA